MLCRGWGGVGWGPTVSIDSVFCVYFYLLISFYLAVFFFAASAKEREPQVKKNIEKNIERKRMKGMTSKIVKTKCIKRIEKLEWGRGM